MPTAERVAKNEAAFRAVNERIKDVSEAFASFGPTLVSFVCECSTQGCFDQVELSLPEYEAVRTEATQFLVVPDHVNAEFERVVFASERYSVVEKLGEAAAVAEAEDPR